MVYITAVGAAITATLATQTLHANAYDVVIGSSAHGFGRGLRDAQAPATAAGAAPAFTGEPVPYDWGPEFITSLSDDSAKYEEELTALLDSPLSAWEVLPQV